MQTKVLNGRYRLEELIGEGGMAVVYRGYDLALNRPVAVKILRGQYGSDASFLRRFEREAQSAARLAHPNIVNVYDVGHDNGVHYIVMEYVRGQTLKHLILRQAPFRVEEAAYVVSQVAAALDYAHRHGLVHRDIKPQNILVDEQGTVKVTDFGIAKGLTDASLTEAGIGMGTVHYVSPEQARGEPATPASDIYSLGVVLYEMLTGRLPFDADNPIGLAMQHVNAPPPSPRQYNPDLPSQVEAIVLRALAKDPAQRFPSAGALAEALSRWHQQPATAGAAFPPPAGRGSSEATRAMGPRARPARVQGAPPPPPRALSRGDELGCATWLIGSAILIGIVALVLLAFRMVDLNPLGTGTQPSPTPTEVVAGVGTATPGSGTPSPAPTRTASPTPTPTPAPTPSPTPETALVPQLLGSTLEQAEAAAAVGDFQLVVEEVFDNVTPAGVIFEQDPQAGTPLPKGSEIRVTVSKGPEFVTLPNLTGQPFTDAIRQIQELGLNYERVEEPSRDVAEGLVIRTEPSGQVRSGETVTVYVSVGDKVRVPDVFGVPYQQARQQLEQAGLVVRSVTPQSCQYIRSQDPSFDCQRFPDGGVVSGTLQWNSWVPRGSAIDIAYYDREAQD
ncbi:protein kinase [Thermomicrobiaceae bacterium CFH 74404]|uniref:non-specific serine/threonine protein kinase n=1 Tax=Thermalbibacter longus TaxID=2951981 RepID=A0AA41WDF6_9BACT|nr:protein kinase [Thermalbibacter longus]MCM8749063.1 protein kinase [Thermalbibacter longus]